MGYVKYFPEPRPYTEDKPCPLPAYCCDQMKAELTSRDGMFDVLCNVPFFANRPPPPTVYVCSDGGYGGAIKIDFCSFCGTEFTWEETVDASV